MGAGTLSRSPSAVKIRTPAAAFRATAPAVHPRCSDGIDVHGSPAWIHGCHISVGDDNVAMHANDTLVEVRAAAIRRVTGRVPLTPRRRRRATGSASPPFVSRRTTFSARGTAQGASVGVLCHRGRGAQAEAEPATRAADVFERPGVRSPALCPTPPLSTAAATACHSIGSLGGYVNLRNITVRRTSFNGARPSRCPALAAVLPTPQFAVARTPPRPTLTFAGTVQAMRIKSDPGATGVLSDVLYSGMCRVSAFLVFWVRSCGCARVCRGVRTGTTGTARHGHDVPRPTPPQR